MIDRIDHIVLNCRNVEATASWYERALGFRRETYSSPAAPGQRIALKFGQHKFNLRQTGDASWWTCKVDAPELARFVLRDGGKSEARHRKARGRRNSHCRRPGPAVGCARPHDVDLLRGSGWQSG
jgi:catechol 2,3-dioxygenase-like lactoylglutathione lyase family enzyme